MTCSSCGALHPADFVHLGGKGRGEGWAGIVESTVDEDAAVAEALRTDKPVRVGSAEGERVFGPYYAREAAIVPLTQDTIVVLGAPNGGLERDDDKLSAEARAADESLAPAGKMKQLADELELLEAVRTAVAVTPSPLDEAMTALAGIAAEALSCELGLLYLADGDRLGVAERGWELKLPRDEVVTSLRNVLIHGAFPFCVQDAHTAPPPGTIAKDKGIPFLLPARAHGARACDARRAHRRGAAWLPTCFAAGSARVSRRLPRRCSASGLRGSGPRKAVRLPDRVRRNSGR